MYPFSATLPTLIAEVLFVFVNSAVQDFALIIFKVVSEPFHASCQQSIPPLVTELFDSLAESGETLTITHIFDHVV